MSIQIAELSSETSKRETVESIQKSKKEISKFFEYINEKNPKISEISRKYEFENIILKTKKNNNNH
jgi:Asp-tRNA(Asn)/Glu-tRNA(Gln) amidotransferase C subunit